MMSRTICLVLLTLVFSIRAAEAQASDAHSPATTEIGREAAISAEWNLYLRALEKLADGDADEGFRLLRELTRDYPDSPAAEKARGRLAAFDSKKDRSGIVGFYLGTMATSLFAFNSVPAIAGAYWGPTGAGLLSLAGVGGGATAAWLLTRDREWTAGQEWWTETVQAVATTNVSIATVVWLPDYIEDSGALAQASSAVIVSSVLGSRAAAYLAVRDASLQSDRPVFAASAYAWAHFYTLLTAYGLLELNDPDIVAAAAIIVPDAAFIGAALAYDQLGWSVARTGLVDVAGIGGALVGASVNLILGAAIQTGSAPVAAGIQMAGAAAGTAVGILLTRNFDAESRQTDRLAFSGQSPRPVLFIPTVAADGSLGVSMRFTL